MQKINKLNEKKNDPEYISYLQNGDSAAVFIVRDIVKSVNTSGMWIDILSTSGGKNEYGKWDFSSITIELFPRKIKPVYPEYSSIADKKYITWKTANEDISKQRKKGYKGKRFVICPKLVNKNQGKTKIVEKIWNKKFNRYVPKHWARSADCEVHKKKIQVKPKWEYHIIAIKKLQSF